MATQYISRNFILAAWLVMLSGHLLAQGKVNIKGTCRTGDHVVVMAWTYSDYISNEEKELGRCTAKNGKFELTFELEETRQVFLQLGGTVGELFAEPGKSYDVIIPVIVRDQQMTFDKTAVDLQFRDLPADDLNFAMRRFDADYQSFIDEHYYDFAVGEYRGSETFKSSLGKKKESTDMIDPIKEKTEEPSFTMPLGSFNNWVEYFRLYVDSGYTTSLTHPFFNDYTRYKIAELELVSGIKPQIIYEDYFFGSPVKYGQPAYFSLFRLLYGNLFAKVTEKDTRDWIRVSINVEKSPESLELAFKNDSLFFRDDICKLAMVNAIRENYFNQEYLKASMEMLMQRMVTSESTRNPKVSAVAASLLNSLLKGRSGWKLEPYEVIDHKGNNVTYSAADGKYVYYFFFTTWSTACQKELMMLEKLQGLYDGYISFVAVCMDDDFNDFTDYVKEHSAQKWLFLFGSADPMLRKKMQLRTIPHAILADGEGRIMYDYTRKPSEGVQKEFEMIKSKMMKKDPNGTRTWKD